MAGKQSPFNQNLIGPTKVSTIERPPGFYKSIVLDVISIVLALGFGYAYYSYLTASISPWWVFGVGLAFGTISVLQAVLTKHYTRRALILLAEAIGFIAFFFRYDDWRVVLLTGTVLFVVLSVGYLRSHSVLENSVEMPFFRGTHDCLAAVTTALLLFMILVYAPQAQGQGVFVPQQSFNTFFTWMSGFLNNFYPNVPFNSSFGDFSESLAKMELQNNPTFNTLSPQAQNQAVAQASSQITQGVSQFAGIKTPQPTAQMSDVVYGSIVSVLGTWQSHLQDKFIIAWVVVLFLILRTFGIIFVWIAQLLTLVIYEMLIASGFMHVGESTQTREVVEY